MVVLTTPSMLIDLYLCANRLGKCFIEIDTTYKMVEDDKLLITPVATQDINHKFRPACYMIS